MHRVFHLRNRAASADRRSLALMGGICVLVLAVVVLIVIAPRYNSSPVVAREAAAMTQIAAFKTVLDVFEADNGFYLTGTNGLQALVRQPAGATNWHGPYSDGAPKDPWSRDYVYECPGKHAASGYPYDLFSLGPPGKNALIANWGSGVKP